MHVRHHYACYMCIEDTTDKSETREWKILSMGTLLDFFHYSTTEKGTCLPDWKYDMMIGVHCKRFFGFVFLVNFTLSLLLKWQSKYHEDPFL